MYWLVSISGLSPFGLPLSRKTYHFNSSDRHSTFLIRQAFYVLQFWIGYELFFMYVELAVACLMLYYTQ